MDDFAAKPKRFNDEDIRDEFQRDRDRILYSKPFRRLSGKTQVFFVGTDDHIRTRLTHTLEVNQIANTISNHLGLNTTLTEAIALGHDIGHAPFGHAGEKILNLIMNGEEKSVNKLTNLEKDFGSKSKGFKHNLQALRILEDLAINYEGKYGLNISKKTLCGIVYHSSLSYKDSSKTSVDFYDGYLEKLNDEDFTIEAQVVKEADEIAQRHHDIEDAIELNLIPKEKLLDKIKSIFEEELEQKKVYKKLIRRIENEDLNKNELIANYSKLIVDIYVTTYIKDLQELLEDLKERNELYYNEFRKHTENNHLKDFFEETAFSDEFKKKDEKFQEFLKNAVLNSQPVQVMDGKGKYIIRKLFQAYFTNPQQMPDKTLISFLKNLKSLSLNEDAKHYDNNQNLKISAYTIRTELEKHHRKILLCENKKEKVNGFFRSVLNKEITICEYKIALMRTITDHIAGMTDKYALKQYEILYGTAY